jgi:hypothetical protein
MEIGKTNTEPFEKIKTHKKSERLEPTRIITEADNKIYGKYISNNV